MLFGSEKRGMSIAKSLVICLFRTSMLMYLPFSKRKANNYDTRRWSCLVNFLHIFYSVCFKLNKKLKENLVKVSYCA